MSLNIAPPLPHNIVNAAAPSTEALARANAIKEVVPATVQVEAVVPQKSREADTRGPIVENPTYSSIRQSGEGSVIPDDPLSQGNTDGQAEQENQQQSDTSSEADEEQSADKNQQDSSAEQRAKEVELDRAEQAQQQVERQEIQQLERRDEEVRAHEQAHASVGGGHAGTPSYQYETGPNGQKYAVSGEVSIDVSKESTPQETIQKMQTVRSAALAPAEPSSQDRKVAAEASQIISEARAELIKEQTQIANASSDDNAPQDVNTESPIGEEPRKRSLAEFGSEHAEAGAIQSHSHDHDKSMTLALDNNEQPATKIIQNRYEQSYQSQIQSFNAVA